MLYVFNDTQHNKTDHIMGLDCNTALYDTQHNYTIMTLSITIP
jgi:hypothetical protein